jgi:3',5'-cyclic AMP phosphodiesterase CpdA
VGSKADQGGLVTEVLAADSRGLNLRPTPAGAPPGTLQEAIGKVNALPMRQAFVIHTGDITHLAKPQQFDDADQIIKGANLRVHYVPGEHDVIDDEGKGYLERYGKSTTGSGWLQRR